MTLSEFVHAPHDERERIYLEVMRRATEAQLAVIRAASDGMVMGRNCAKQGSGEDSAL